MAGLAEASGGLLLALGFLTPVAGAIIFSVMLVAAVSVHLKGGFFITSGGYEYNLALGVAGLAIAFTGPGAVSLDSLLGYSLAGDWWGLTAFATGVVGGAIQLAQRRPAPVLQPATAE